MDKIQPESFEISEPPQDLMLYDEALSRAGGFGIYQAIMVFCLSNLSVYGSAIIYNFGFLTNHVVGSPDYC